MKENVVTIVDMEELNDNIINFKSGNATLDFEMPLGNKLKIVLFRKFGNTDLPVTSFSLRKSKSLNNIQDGDYVITAFGRINDIDTNITVNTTIKSGETKKIKF